jgi:FixJ family two-component response regulator
MNAEAKVFVVDDDLAERDALGLLLKQAGFDMKGYPSAESFLQDYDPNQPGCLVLDIILPGMSGLELQQKLADAAVAMPIIFLTGHGDVTRSARAFKAGAVDFVEKPCDCDDLLERIQDAIEIDARWRLEDLEKSGIMHRFTRLTPREREVMAFMVSNKSSKEIAAQLNVSHRTIEVHRSRVLHKMEVDSLLELVTMLSAFRITERQPLRRVESTSR